MNIIIDKYILIDTGPIINPPKKKQENKKQFKKNNLITSFIKIELILKNLYMTFLYLSPQIKL